MKKYTLLALGPATPETDAAWLKSPRIVRVFRHRRAAINGKRFGSRLFGIGLDSLVLALKTFQPSIKGPYLANNPWIGAALRLTGRSDFVVTGIYAEPSSRSWRVLRMLVGNAHVIALSKSETVPWNSAGGRAQAVLYGNTFGYPPRSESDHFHVFVGGTSDRDPRVMEQLEAEVLTSEEPVRLTLATGERGEEKRHGSNVVCRPGYLKKEEFGELLSTASVVFLPISQGTRAAGHMVLVGALESGIPVMITSSEGMREYATGPFIAVCDSGQPILPQLRTLGHREVSADMIHRYWHDNFSLESYVRRVTGVLNAGKPE
ncbi:hypothetical protein J2W15_004356 [Pseudarthrobacter sulfonivorans]|nr:hypothetical protein [Pseudarthrobacter sulfonivorans]